ncbi:MAG TPA: outer membrane beta-barrel protein [Bacteroidia bacterium]|nr:outer membrane beta-barrel protein [Bacteroidia bacterium]
MNKYVLTIAALFTVKMLFAITAKGVNEDQSNSHFGFSIGKNLSYPVGTYDDHMREKAGVTLKRLGYAVSIHYQYGFSSHWALHTEIMYQAKRDYFYRGYSYIGGQPYFSISDELKLSVPVLVRFNSKRFFAEIGPYIGLMNGTKIYSCSSIGDKLELLYKRTSSEFFKGACLGIGYNVIDKERFSVAINLRNDQEILFKKKFLWDHPYNTTMLLAAFNYKL